MRDPFDPVVRPARDDADVPNARRARRNRPRWLALVEELNVDRRAVVAVCLVVVVAVGAAGFIWLRSQSSGPSYASGDDADLVDPSASPTSTALNGLPPATSAPTKVVVDVSGRVRHPGIVTVSSTARAADAIKAAGGPLPHTDLTSINLAAHVTDGEQIVVGGGAASTGASGAGGSGGSGGTAGSGVTGAKVDINTASAQELDALPGVGPVMAGRIVAYRQAHGSFKSVDELQDVSGIGPSKYKQLAPLVSV